MRDLMKSLRWAALFLPAVFTSHAQIATGVYPFGSFDNRGFDTVNIANLNVNFSIPVFSKPGRGGLNFSYALVYDNSIWTPSSASGTLTWDHATQWGWTNSTSGPAGLLDFNLTTQYCNSTGSNTEEENAFYYVDGAGLAHTFSGSISNCPDNSDDASFTTTALDSSGFTLTANAVDDFVITDRNGKTITPATTTTNAAASVTDNNGNQITVSPTGTVTDTTGTNVLTVTGAGTAGSPAVYTYPVWLNPTSTTTSASVTVHYSSYNIATAFSCGGIAEFSQAGVSLVDYIQLADGETYSFTYEPTPGSPSTTTGRLQSITLPTHGVINYAYLGGNNGIVCADGGTAVLQRSISIPSGTSVTYTRMPLTTSTTRTDVVDGLSNYKSYYFIADIADDPSHTFYPYQAFFLQGLINNTPILSQATCYIHFVFRGQSQNTCGSNPLVLPFSPVRTSNTYNGSETNAIWVFQGPSNPSTNTVYWDFAANATSSGSQILTVTKTYSPAGSLQATQSAGFANVASSVTYNDDTSTPVATSGLPQHGGTTGTNGRGNLNSIQVLTGNSSSSITAASYAVDDAGQTIQSTDMNGKTTAYAYDATDTFLHRLTLPATSQATQQITYNYDIASGVLKSITDQNNNTTYFTYDNRLRLLTTKYPDGGLVATSYNLSSSTPSSTMSVLHSSGSSITTTSYFDAYGRLSQTDTADNPHDDLVDYSYDANGNRYTVSNPYHAGDSRLYTTYAYDVLGRNTLVTEPDGSTQQFVYSGNTTLFQDEAGHQRKYTYDGAGRITSVLEPDSNGNLTVETDYAYLQNFTTSAPITYQTVVQQKGGSSSASSWRTRTFTYDLAGRLLSEAVPESGTTAYTYPNGSSSCAGSLSLPCTHTDANGTVTNYAYDAIGRITGKTYSGSANASATHPVYYYYDQSSFNGLSIANPLGNRTGMSDASGSTAWSFDVMNRPNQTRKTIGNTTAQATYTYNDDGSLNMLQDFSGTAFTYTYDSVGRPTGVTDSNGRSYASNATYNAASQLIGLNQQLTSTGAQFARSFAYNNRLQPQTIQAQAGTTPIQSLSYTYGTPQYNNGNISAITNGMDTSHNRDQAFTYDNMNRLFTGQDGAHWGEQYGYDNWGNMLSKTVTLGSGNQFSVTAGANNRLSNLTYDAAGEAVADQFGTTFTYDAEGRILTAGSGAYVYDGDGYRVSKTVSGTSTLYWPSAISGIADESNATATSWGRQVNFGGLTLWSEDTAGNGKFLFQDHLGSTRLTADAQGNVKDDIDYTPFGLIAANYGPGSDIHYQFTGTESDPESSTTYNIFRNLSPSLGRFHRPDPYDGSYNFSNPQSLNRYTYALNRPIIFTDPSGLECNAEGNWTYAEGDPSPHPYSTDGTDCNNSGGGGGDSGSGVDSADGSNRDPGTANPIPFYLQVNVYGRWDAGPFDGFRGGPGGYLAPAPIDVSGGGFGAGGGIALSTVTAVALNPGPATFQAIVKQFCNIAYGACKINAALANGAQTMIGSLGGDGVLGGIFTGLGNSGVSVGDAMDNTCKPKLLACYADHGIDP